ncbi:hypothetical protein SETIT_2G249000v2 [Setaria italica]|uniref:Peptidase A1 domain-containing protein n=1 Tax=Setaria italica TaxID=4555 RepID=K3ZSS2_SETIT|nr:aspartyl protease family protein At5g10770 isoform X1 [Setaria italica]RCV12179.1 hypothetical protein SETIT_2G249000v2 [Setaria italica]
MASGARCSARHGHGRRGIAAVLALAALASPCRHGAAAAAAAEGSEPKKWHVVSISSLLPSTACTAAKAASKSSALRVVHRHGPCSPLHARGDAPSHAEILERDQDRVDSIRRRIAGASAIISDADRVADSKTVSLPARWGIPLDTTNYITTVGLGTPPRNLSVEIDTGSDLSWVQCKPCARCYEQQDPLYDPAQSSTHSAVPCGSRECQKVEAQRCAADDKCRYDITYADKSHTNGTVVRDALTLAVSHALPGFVFGCGHDNDMGPYDKIDGIFGLNRGKVSLPSQVAARYGGAGFSYCLPSSPSAEGYLAFGGAAPPPNAQFTEMVNGAEPSSYYLDLVGIKVAGRELEIPPAVFAAGGTIIDTGTVISRLPPRAYAALRSAFVRSMAAYRRAPALSLLDTCYNFTGHTRVRIPSAALVFAGGTTVSLNARGLLFVSTVSQTCLGFASTGDETTVNILGNTQQKTFTVIYDVDKKRIGFGAKGCN